VTLPALSLAAEASSTKIPALEAQLKNKPGDSAAAIELARLYYQKKEYAKATPFLWKHIDSLQRRDLQILLKCHAELEQSEDLLRASNLLISKNDKDYEAYHYQGRGYYLKKKENEALESFKKAITINKKYLPSYLAIGEIYEKKNN